MPEEDQKFNVLMIAPREIRRKILKDYTLTTLPMYLHLKQHTLELVVREAVDGKRPPLGALVEWQDDQGEAEDGRGIEEGAAARIGENSWPR